MCSDKRLLERKCMVIRTSACSYFQGSYAVIFMQYDMTHICMYHCVSGTKKTKGIQHLKCIPRYGNLSATLYNNPSFIGEKKNSRGPYVKLLNEMKLAIVSDSYYRSGS